MTAVLPHLSGLVHGLAASLACYLLLHLAGVALVPARWERTLGRGASPAIAGAALYVLAAWYSVQRHAPLTQVVLGFLAFTFALSILRFRHVASRLRPAAADRAVAGWLGLFAALYALAYVFTIPPVTRDHLPVTWMGSKDILYYLNYAAYLLRLGPTTLRTVTTEYFAYYQTPGAFHLLGGFSLFFASPLHALMPAQFGLTALAGVASAWIARRVFLVSPLAAALVGSVAVASPFFRYIVGNYSLSTLFALPVLLHLLAVTLRHPLPKGGWISGSLTCLLFVHYLLLFLVYPYLYVIGIGFQSTVVVLRALAGLTSPKGSPERSSPTTVARFVVTMGASASVAVVALLLCTPQHSTWVAGMLRMLSQPGIAGWPKDLISPLALLGIPAPLHAVEAGGALRPWALAALAAPGSAALLWWLVARRAALEARVFLAVGGLGFLAYAGYFTVVGVSYQQWKLASYVAMPFGFVFLAACLAWLEGRPGRAGSPRPRVPLAAAVAALAGVLLVGGNLAVHLTKDTSFYRPPASLRNLAALQELPFRDLSVQASDVTTLFAAYFLPGKRFHTPSREFSRAEPINLATISRAQPLFIADFSCEGVGHADTRDVEGVGCLLFQPPSLAPETAYPFDRTYLFVEMRGLSPREPGGRWNTQGVVSLTLMADQRALQVDRDAAYVNLLLEPALLPGMTGQRLGLAWGDGRRAEALLGQREWISLPLRVADWPETRFTRQAITVELPDVLPPHWIDGPRGRYLESRPLAVRFVELSVSKAPRGRAIPPGSDGRVRLPAE